MRDFTPFEKKTQKAALAFFVCGCMLVLALQFTVGLYFTQHYFVAHFLLGLFVPFFFYSLGGNSLTFWIGMLATATFHFGYEFWEDQLDRSTTVYDWDQIASGAVGLLAAFFVYRAWTKLHKAPSHA